MSTSKLRNIGPKSAAWLRQVGLRTQEDLVAVGSVEAFVRVKRAGFRPSLNLLYALEGALLDCHWQQLPEARRGELLVAYDAAAALLPAPRDRPVAAPVTTTQVQEDEHMVPSMNLFDYTGGDHDD
ncbi:TfoX/Sxy family protein [Pseudoxanthomonas indica]|uniref:Transcriptional regulator of competence genes, TfoX/Sxy family n=1 Tax=Pseudoxanthomonas indica TaxID=428993 RepID=A0A1T5LAX0_9GAMM|nr:transcriptional regulator [Pseudoxanthomonas indica]SKC73187.1 Transcriptional regulator of competence genes, TfoX/Sxy family [Pseudoxanthomonas indica]